MSHSNRPLIGSVFERKISAANQPQSSGSSQTGFPAVQHRSKSAFARGREELKQNAAVIAPTKYREVPVVQSVGNRRSGIVRDAGGRAPKPAADVDDLRRQISEENERKVENMTELERDQERREIIEQFGTGVGDLLKKARGARERRLVQEHEHGSVKTPQNDPVERPEQAANGSKDQGMLLDHQLFHLISSAKVPLQTEYKKFTGSRGERYDF